MMLGKRQLAVLQVVSDFGDVSVRAVRGWLGMRKPEPLFIHTNELRKVLRGLVQRGLLSSRDIGGGVMVYHTTAAGREALAVARQGVANGTR